MCKQHKISRVVDVIFLQDVNKYLDRGRKVICHHFQPETLNLVLQEYWIHIIFIYDDIFSNMLIFDDISISHHRQDKLDLARRGGIG